MTMNENITKNFLTNYSIEVTPNAAVKIDNFAEVLPKNTRIYIAHIEGTPFEDMIKTAKKINDEGFIPMPHFPARIIKNKSTLKDNLELIRDDIRWFDRSGMPINKPNDLLKESSSEPKTEL